MKNNNEIVKKPLYQLTEEGRRKCDHFIKQCQAKRKEIMDSGVDTTEDTNLPSMEDIESEIAVFVDEKGDYYNCWGITDHYDSDPLCLQLYVDFTEVKNGNYLFHTVDSEFLQYDGTEVEIIRPLTEEECDIADVGNMYEIRFCDGKIGEAFDDELTVHN